MVVESFFVRVYITTANVDVECHLNRRNDMVWCVLHLNHRNGMGHKTVESVERNHLNTKTAKKQVAVHAWILCSPVTLWELCASVIFPGFACIVLFDGVCFFYPTLHIYGVWFLRPTCHKSLPPTFLFSLWW